MTRISKDEYFMQIAEIVAKRATCLKKQVGTVIVDFNGYIIATGYNGQPRGIQHCDEQSPCLASMDPTISCSAIHAEMNALMQCPDTSKIHKIYCTHFPCDKCMMMIANTRCVELIYLNGPDKITHIIYTTPKITQLNKTKEKSFPL